MRLFYFTFGQKYRHETHPNGGHPDGWFAVQAANSEEARSKMFAECGVLWAMQYDEQPSTDTFPRGELRRL